MRIWAYIGMGLALLFSAAASAQAGAAVIAAQSGLFGIPGLTFTGAGTWTGVTMFAAYLVREWRETRKLSAEDRLARREGYAKQVEMLLGAQDRDRAENRRLRGDLQSLENTHDEYRRACQEETDQLRGDIRRLEDDLNGYRRRLDASAAEAGRVVISGSYPDALKSREKFGGQKS